MYIFRNQDVKKKIRKLQMTIHVMIYSGQCVFKIYYTCVKSYIYILAMNKHMNNMNSDKPEAWLLNTDF